MGLTGRHRMRTHAGMPHGSTVKAGSNLMMYYQFNTGESSTSWPDQSSHERRAEPDGEETAPEVVVGGGLDFNDTNSSEDSSSMSFTKFTVQENYNFLSFIVCKPEDATNTLCYLSDSGSEVLQFTSANQHQLKTGTGGGTSSMTHSSIFTCPPGEKFLFMIHRTGDNTGTIKIYKNGLVCNGHNNSGTTNPGIFELQNLGVKNNPTSESNWFNGVMYDVGLIKAQGATDKVRDMITDYLCLKHGIERVGNY